VKHEGPQPEEIQSIFSAVADGYDKANDAMTFGLARRWRRQLVNWSGVRAGQTVLDCATGTGDLALEFKKVVGHGGRVVGTDFCREMLSKAPPKAAQLGLEVDFQWADAMNLPFTDASFDVASIAYGIRNVRDPQRALSEMARVVKPGGHVMVLETGDSANSVLKRAFDFYFQKVVPRIGGWVTGKRFAYEYLNRSSRGFPSRDRFVQIMNATGRFAECECRVLMGGASYLYRGTVSTKSALN
jgi:demethylmenaquinone methyltransferase/2-methoxy-6-polyprenyl-1,4-benzoquinol methylase